MADNWMAKIQIIHAQVRVADARSGEGWVLYWCPLLADGKPDEEYEPEPEDEIPWPFGADDIKTSEEMNQAGYLVLR